MLRRDLSQTHSISTQMLICEFIDRTGFCPTENYYHTVIEPEYMKSDIDKDAWCKQWKKGDGIQKAYDAIAEEVNEEYRQTLNLEAEVKGLKSEISRVRDENQAFHDDRRQRIDERIAMASFLIEQSAKWSATDLREKAIEMIGEKAYLRYKIEHNINLWEMDKELLIENLK